MENEQHNPFAPPRHSMDYSRMASPYSTPKLISVSLLFAASVTGASFTTLGHFVGMTSGGEVAIVLGVGLAITTAALGACRGLKDAIYPAQLVNFTIWLTMCLSALAGSKWFAGSTLPWSDVLIFVWIWLAGIVVVSVITWLGSKFH